MKRNLIPDLCRTLLLCFGIAGLAFSETFMVPMRDGTNLALDCYMPGEGGPAYPVVLVRSTYDRGGGAMMAPVFTGRGYAFAIEDTRGRGGSDGKDTAFGDDGWGKNQDGMDTVEWLRKQPWCNGKIATWGESALGITQLFMAAAGASVDAQAVGLAASDFFGQGVYQGGVFRKGLIDTWLTQQGIPDVLALWHGHPAYDDFWTFYNTEPRAAQANAPAVHWGAWFDIFNQGTINSFVAWQHSGGPHAKGNQKLIMGPWTHGPKQRSGEMKFPENFNFDIPEYELRFYDYWLKGVDNGIMKEPAVHYYTMGDCSDPSAPGNEWRTADDWPPFATQETPFCLTQDGSLTSDISALAEGTRSFTYDPKDPCPTVGGQNLFQPSGPHDQRKVSSRPDVLKFVSLPLDAPLEVTGNVKVRLNVSTDAPDTDFTAKLVDIYPDGREMLMLDGIQRLKFRNGREEAQPLTPGEVGTVTIDLWSISLIFNKGHQIGVHISSSNYPRFELNPNTGEDFPEGDLRPARNTVHTGGQNPSAILLPVRK
ncbi:MAG: CocE/NonD family hydrolase [Candidatus Hydrogenedentes bacterium]|nr:CocE/NonD family hydrolase [Candidatus Hydrogenedentota bacterium]